MDFKGQPYMDITMMQFKTMWQEVNGRWFDWIAISTTERIRFEKYWAMAYSPRAMNMVRMQDLNYVHPEWEGDRDSIEDTTTNKKP